MFQESLNVSLSQDSDSPCFIDVTCTRVHVFSMIVHVNSVSLKLQVGQSLFAGFGGKGLSNAEGSTLLVSDQQVPRISMS